MATPSANPTSKQFAPRIGTPVADAAVTPVAVTGNFAWVAPTIEWTVGPLDTLSDVTRRLYGANTPANRHKVRNQGFTVGNTIRATGAYPLSKDQDN